MAKAIELKNTAGLPPRKDHGMILYIMRGVEESVEEIGAAQCFGYATSMEYRPILARTFDSLAGEFRGWMTLIEEESGNARYPDPPLPDRRKSPPKSQDKRGGYRWVYTNLTTMWSTVSFYGPERFFVVGDSIERQKFAAECRRFIDVLERWSLLIRMLPPNEVVEANWREFREAERQVAITKLPDAIKAATGIKDQTKLARLAEDLLAAASKAINQAVDRN
jgi:hypothetical protein